MHWYTKAGESCHEVPNKSSGGMRATTLTDARKLGLVPSVTTIMDIQSKPALIAWIQNQLLDAVIDKPFDVYKWTEEEYKRQMIEQSRKVGRDAADKGNYVHDLMDKYFKTGVKDEVYVPPILALLDSEFPGVEWISEEGFAHESGFGGRVDLHSKTHNIIVDFKTKDKEDIKAVKAYDDHKVQLSAYQMGLRLPDSTKRYNLFTSVAKGFEGSSNLVEAKDFEQPRDIFTALLDLWKVKNKYDSSFNS